MLITVDSGKLCDFVYVIMTCITEVNYVLLQLDQQFSSNAFSAISDHTDLLLQHDYAFQLDRRELI